MFFASEYAYDYGGDSDEEVVSDEELEHGMNISGSDDDDDDDADDADAGAPGRVKGFLTSIFRGRKSSDPQPKKAPIKRAQWKQLALNGDCNDQQEQCRRKGKRFRRSDVNIVSIKFDTLVTPSNMHTGDLIRCTNCPAILSHISSLSNGDRESQVWTCDFCGHANEVDIDKEEIPKTDDVTFLLEPAPVTTATGSTKKPLEMDESMIIFCVDISGSMGITSNEPGGGIISRLDGARVAVYNQIEELEKTYPNRRVALLTFHNTVTVHGDGMGHASDIENTALDNFDKLVQIGTKQSQPNHIKNSSEALKKMVKGLHDSGMTALGPALVIAVGMASKFSGSKIILCTDGKANVGLGQVEHNDAQTTYDFYTKVGQLALQNSVSVSVISFTGTDCQLSQLGRVVDITSGQLNIVDPVKLGEEFHSILSEKVIATNVTATFLVYKGLYIRHDDAVDNKVTRIIGNVTNDSVITFEYGFKHKNNETDAKSDGEDKGKRASVSVDKEKEAKTDKTEDNTRDMETEEAKTTESLDGVGNKEAGAAALEGASSSNGADSRSHMPFQLQVEYKDTAGSKALRVITHQKPVTKDRVKAEKDVMMKVVAMHSKNLCLENAAAGNMFEARGVAMMNQRLMYRAGMTSTASKQAYRDAYGIVNSIENDIHAEMREQVYDLTSPPRYQNLPSGGGQAAKKKQVNLSNVRMQQDNFVQQMHAYKKK